MQLIVLEALDHHPWLPLQANALALLVSTQLSFILNCLIIWADRPTGRRLLLRRWIGFQGATLSTSLLNLLVFTLACTVLPDEAAMVLGSSAGAVAGYILNGLLVFQSQAQSYDQCRAA